MKPRIGVLTSGGDCPGLNAVLRGVALAAEKQGWEVVGFRDGFEGLLPPGNHVILDRENTNGIMALGGTIIGTLIVVISLPKPVPDSDDRRTLRVNGGATKITKCAMCRSERPSIV